ncbi:MAG: GNAT family N-acetyltransferase [Clostridium sp.]|nr:GNAT family N-acetyltransferase [Clostridium sp.]
MQYFIKNSMRKNMLEAYDESKNLVGEAVISSFMSSEIFDQPRLNIYIDISVKDMADKIEIKDQLLYELINRGKTIAKKEKEQIKNLEVKFYHCCFSDDRENIEYYSSKEGFKYDEGMHILKLEIGEDKVETTQIKEIEFVNLELSDDEEINELVKKQGEIFASGYSVDDLKKIESENEYFSIAAKHKGEIVGNVMVIVKENEDNSQYGWIDDMFVSKGYRRLGIGRNLMLAAINKLRILAVKESRLEVWSSNIRAIAMYNSVGYKFYEEVESAIGMFL